MRAGYVAFLALVSCVANPPPHVAPPQAPYPAPAYAPLPAPLTHRPNAPRTVPVRVLGARWRGQWPSDESGAWSLADAPLIVSNLNASATGTGLSFWLESSSALEVDDRFAEIPTTRADATASMASFAASGRVSNQTLTVVVVWPSRTSWVSGWGQQGHPLRTPGRWPIIIVNTRIAKSRDAHWIGHELGHVFGFYDTTFYDAAPVDNLPYRQCGLFIPTRTYPRNMAPAGARQNLMSYETSERTGYFSAGYELTHRQILDCWIRSSGL